MNFSPGVGAIIREMVIEEKRTHSEVSTLLKQYFPGSKGLSTRSVRRYCAENDIHKTSRLRAKMLDRVVWSSIQKVCGCFVDIHAFLLALTYIHI